MDPSWLYYALAVALAIVGLVGIIAPVLPGIPILFAGLWLAAWAGEFEHVGFWPLVILAMLAALSVLVDLLSSLAGAKRVGASTRGIVGAGLGTLVGLFFGIPGVLLGPFIGAIAGEMTAGRRIEEASRIGVGTWVGLIIGTAAKVAIAFAMLGVFAIAWWL